VDGQVVNGGGFGFLLLALTLSWVNALLSQSAQTGSLSFGCFNRNAGPFTNGAGKQFAFDSGFKLPVLAALRSGLVSPLQLSLHFDMIFTDCLQTELLYLGEFESILGL